MSDKKMGFGRGRARVARESQMDAPSARTFSSNPKEESENDIDVPADKVGRIIGRKGAKIQELQQQTGAGIQVSRDTNNDGTVRVSLMGPIDAVDAAKTLIQEIVDGGNMSNGFGSSSPTKYNSFGNGSTSWFSNNHTSPSKNLNSSAPTYPPPDEEDWENDPIPAPPQTSANTQQASNSMGDYNEEDHKSSNYNGSGGGGGFGSSNREMGGFSSSNDGGRGSRGGYGRGRGRSRGSAGGYNSSDGGGFGRQNHERAEFGERRSDESSGFGSRNNDFGSRTGGGFGSGRHDSGGFGKGQDSGGFGRRHDSGEFDRRNDDSGFGNRRNHEGGFGSRQNSDNWFDSRRNDDGGYGRRKNEGGGFGRRSDDGGFVSRQNSDGGFGSRRNDDSGFGRRSDEGSYGSGRNGSGFGSRHDDSGRFENKEGGSGFGGGRSSSGFGGLGDVTEIEVYSRNIPKIIGRGGSKIRELQDESGARIKIDQDDNSSSYQKVYLTGSSEARQKAKDMIDEIVNPANPFQQMADALASIPAPTRKPLDWGKIKEDSERHRAEYLASLPPIEKCFYQEDSQVAAMSLQQADKLRSEHMNIQVSDFKKGEDRCPNPVSTFEQAFSKYPEILQEIRKQKFEKPSPIQMQAWPVLMQGLDLIGIAQTGTGKTLAFLLPAFIHIEGQPVPRSEREGPTVLCLSPTRELALQIQQEVVKYSYKGIKCVCVYGGGDRREQIQTVSKGVEIIVATPGRLNDLIQNKIVSVKSITYLILDEADRMLDMGFEYEIKKIILGIRPDRQTVMTSATWPQGVQKMADQYLTDPIQVFVGSLDLAAVHSVTQLVEVIDEDDKRDRLVHFLTEEMEEDDKVIVFVGKKAIADDISSDFAIAGIHCDCIHGGREQEDREAAIENLKTGYIHILIATDVASRGLDIKDVTHVFNYDFPRNIEEYVHRVGRTGRAGRTGVSLTLMCRKDWRQAPELIRIMEEADQEVPEDLREMAERWQRKRTQMDNERESFRAIGGGRRYGDRDGGDRSGGFGSGGFGGGGRRDRRRDRDGGVRISYDGV